MLVAIPEAAKATLERLYREDAAQRAAGLPVSQRTRNIDRQSGRFISMLARTMNAQAILEMGSSNGVSTIWFALAAMQTGRPGYRDGTHPRARR